MSAALTQFTISVEQVGKFGIKANGQWFSVDAPGLSQNSFIAGQQYVVGVTYSKSNKPYIKQVVSGQLNTAAAPAAPVAGTPPPPPPPAGAPAAPPPPAAPAPAPAAPPAPRPTAGQEDKDRRISRLSVLSTVIGSQWFANEAAGFGQGTDADQTLARALALAEKLEAWVYRV